ncbi:hypothetical protein VC83_08967 [Pseudogymnoascus destructans]|uniref:BRCT domain-containing protein n=2 Tax=Pseudogymnoascus destructans TaxID=655981 RepID=L8GBJ5_PSED2|nr:uncharacterized protein VC83_08967 [Pseudogymnoascus destructans]ELR10239.1 hypothetical protein GMDG_04627 [Pseudogymnoascus destructans 20631-21]OAF54713.1 hypothetical protein VC83_08967 [Pseudogymnoascus destructans]
MVATTSKAGDPTFSTSQPLALWPDGPLHVTAGSESLDTQLIRNLQEKHLLDDSQVAFLSVPATSVPRPEHVCSQPSQIFVDKGSAIHGQSGEGEDTQTSDIVDFGSLLETQARRASTAGSGDGQKETSLNRDRPNKEGLHGKKYEPESITSDKDKTLHCRDDKHQPRHAASHRSGEKSNNSKQQPRTYNQRSATSTTKHGKSLNRPTKHSMDDWQPSDANLSEPDGSPTQKNNSLAYGDMHIPSSSPVPGHDDELPLQTNLGPTASARSYDENETGSVRFSFTTSKVHAPINRESSIGIDEGFTVHEAPMELGPETPAPPENPFAKSKPPLQGTQLFNNTQSSPVDPHVLESGSSRPSPGMFGFGVQSSRNRVLSSVTDRFQQVSYHPPGDLSSPLLHQAKSAATNRSRDNEAPGHGHRLPAFTSPLYHHGSKTPASASYRGHIPVAHETPVPRTSKSFQHRAISFKGSEPHEYVSREESQQRRLQKQAQAEADSDSEEDSFERDQAIRAKQRKMREDAAKELAQVSVTRAPKEEEVEVPATGQKRRSVSQEYVAQCYDADARDNQTSTQIRDSIKTDENDQGDTQAGTQAEMTIVDSQIPIAAPVDSPSPSNRSSRLEKGPIPSNDCFNLTNQSNTASTDLKPQGNEVLPPLPTLENNSDTESAHRESSMSPRMRSPRTSSGRFGKSGLPQTPGRLSQAVFMPASAEDMVPETSPAKLFDMDDSPEPSLVSIGGLGFTQDDPEYDAIASPIRDLAMKRGVKVGPANTAKSNIAASKKVAISKKSQVVFSGESAMSSSLPLIPSIKPILAAPSQIVPSSADNLQSADVDAADSSPVRPATRAARKARRASGVVFDSKQVPRESQVSEDDVVMITAQKSVSPIRQSIGTIGEAPTGETELLPCPFYSADRPCNMKDHQAYYHDEEIRQMYLKRHRPAAPMISSGVTSSGSKDSAFLPSTQHSGNAEEISSHLPATANLKSSENISTYVTLHDSNLRHSTSSSLSELPSEYDNDEFFTAVMENSNTRNRDDRSRSTDTTTDTSDNGTPARDYAESMPPPTVRRKLSFPQGPLTASQTRFRNEAIQGSKAVEATGKAKLSAQSSRSNSRASRRTMSTTDFSEEGSSTVVELTPVRPQRPARSTRRASINYDTKSDSSKSSSPDILTKGPPTLPKAVHLQKTTNPTLFANMAFAISYKGDTAQDISDRTAVTRLVKSHGGRLLDGFNDLFTDGPTSVLTTPSTATKQPLPPLKHKQKQIGELALAPAAQDLGFVAFIGDHYTRKSKFVQALALGLPCLSGRWVTTCVARGRIVPFLPFLLAAGESSYLGGAVRSRLLAPYDPSTARFEETFERREKLLGGKRVIFLMGRGKAEERKRAYLFLTRALGAGEVRRVASVKEAREVVEKGGGWDLVYVDDDRKVAGAEAEILGGVESGTKAKGKAKGKAGKRKRGDEVEDEKTGLEQGGERKKVRVVGDEFVVQSLILGCLMDEE